MYDKEATSLNNKYLYLIIIILLITNIVSVITLSGKENTFYLLKMKGEGDYWRIEDYQFAYLPNMNGAELGNGKVSYLGDIEEIKGDIDLKIYDRYNGEELLRQSEIARLEDNNFFITASGGSYLPLYLNLKDINEKMYFTIEWETIDRDKHTEKIQMTIDFTLHGLRPLLNGR